MGCHSLPTFYPPFSMIVPSVYFPMSESEYIRNITSPVFLSTTKTLGEIKKKSNFPFPVFFLWDFLDKHKCVFVFNSLNYFLFGKFRLPFGACPTNCFFLCFFVTHVIVSTACKISGATNALSHRNIPMLPGFITLNMEWSILILLAGQ